MGNRRTKITYWSRIINQFVASVMSGLVWILFVVANVIVKLIINARFYLHISKRKYTCANCTPADISDITPGSVDIEINELKDNLIKIEGINTLLRENNQKLREENTIIKNWNEVNKASSTNKISELETQVKNLQKSLTEANRKNVE